MLNPSAFLGELHARKSSVAVIGLGYVGLPLAVALARKFRVVGFDVSEERIALLRAQRDPSGEMTSEELRVASIDYTSDPRALRAAAVLIVAVPTPIDENKNPDLEPLRLASEAIGKNLSPGAIVCFESTVYPGVTEEFCGPRIEEHSGLSSGVDFFLAYSPERINPGDRERTIEKITKVVSGQTGDVLETEPNATTAREQ